MTSGRRTRAFTMAELMTVVAIIGIMAAIAVISLKRSRSTGDVDAWAGQLRNMINQAHRRAMATNMVYMIDLRNQQAQMCQVDVGTTCSCTYGCASIPATCPNTNAGTENGGIARAGVSAWTDSYNANGADVIQPGVAYAAMAHTTLSGSHPIYFGPTGSVDDTWANVCPNSATAARGFDIYLRSSDATPGTATTQNQKRRRIAVYGISGRPRIIDNW